ncbi:MAG: hypothetical protein QM750_19915 [Rubrivivax sp.]
MSTTYSTPAAAARRAIHLAKRHGESMFIGWVPEDDGFAVASEVDLDTYWLGARVHAEILADGTYASADD